MSQIIVVIVVLQEQLNNNTNNLQVPFDVHTKDWQ